MFMAFLRFWVQKLYVAVCCCCCTTYSTRQMLIIWSLILWDLYFGGRIRIRPLRTDHNVEHTQSWIIITVWQKNKRFLPSQSRTVHRYVRCGAGDYGDAVMEGIISKARDLNMFRYFDILRLSIRHPSTVCIRYLICVRREAGDRRATLRLSSIYLKLDISIFWHEKTHTISFKDVHPTRNTGMYVVEQVMTASLWL